MRTALADDYPLNGCFAAGAGETGPAEYLQFVPVAALVFCHRVKIGFTGSQ
jgi:hypothetical protein